MDWTEERVALLKKLWADGLSASQIANRLGGITRNAAIGKVHRLGLTGRVTTSRIRVPRPCKPVVDHAAWRASNFVQLRAKLQVMLPAAGDTALKPVFVPVEKKAVALMPMLVAAAAPKAVGVQLLDLNENMCRWPIGEPQDENFHFCGCPATSGSYCEHHTRIAYQPDSPRKK